jgi:hypothetical protein
VRSSPLFSFVTAAAAAAAHVCSFASVPNPLAALFAARLRTIVEHSLRFYYFHVSVMNVRTFCGWLGMTSLLHEDNPASIFHLLQVPHVYVWLPLFIKRQKCFHLLSHECTTETL